MHCKPGFASFAWDRICSLALYILSGREWVQTAETRGAMQNRLVSLQTCTSFTSAIGLRRARLSAQSGTAARSEPTLAPTFRDYMCQFTCWQNL